MIRALGKIAPSRRVERVRTHDQQLLRARRLRDRADAGARHNARQRARSAARHRCRHGPAGRCASGSAAARGGCRAGLHARAYETPRLSRPARPNDDHGRHQDFPKRIDSQRRRSARLQPWRHHRARQQRAQRGHFDSRLRRPHLDRSRQYRGVGRRLLAHDGEWRRGQHAQHGPARLWRRRRLSRRLLGLVGQLRDGRRGQFPHEKRRANRRR